MFKNFTDIILGQLDIILKNGNIDLTIGKVSYKPYPNNPDELYRELVQTYEQNLNKNLIIKIGQQRNSKNIDIEISNLKFIMISRYLDEFVAFIKEVLNDMNETKEQVNLEYKKPEDNIQLNNKSVQFKLKNNISV